MGRRGANATVLRGRQSDVRARGGRRPVGGCSAYLYLEDVVVAWADVGAHGQTRSQGCAQAHTAGVLICVGACAATELYPAPPEFASISRLCLLSTILYSHLYDTQATQKSGCWKSSIVKYSSSGSCGLCLNGEQNINQHTIHEKIWSYIPGCQM